MYEHARRAVLMAVFISSVWFRPCHAQEGAVVVESDGFFETIVQLADRGMLPEEQEKAVFAYIQAKLDYEAAMLANTQSVIARTNETAHLVLWVAHIAVAVGFVAALLEFYHTMQLRRRGRSVADTEVTLQLESIAVRTTSIGLLILMLSLIMYFLFLKFVYPVQVLGAGLHGG
jgi:hypothetical protein